MQGNRRHGQTKKPLQREAGGAGKNRLTYFKDTHLHLMFIKWGNMYPIGLLLFFLSIWY